MMAFFVDWIKNIILLILLASFLDLILPSSQMQRYVKLVMGFLLILMILSPVLQLFQLDHDQMFASIEELTGTQQRESQLRFQQEQQQIEAWQRQAILDEVEVQWRQEIKEKLELEYNIVVQQVSLQLEAGRNNQAELEVKELVLTLQDRSTVNDKRSVESQINPIEPIQEVNIQIGNKKNLRTSGEPGNAVTARANPPFQQKMDEDILQLVQKEWNISVDKIHIQWIRR